MSVAREKSPIWLARLDEIALLALLIGIAAVLSAAMVLQIGYHEIPCPLCLIERAAMFGICFGLFPRVRRRDPVRATGLGLVASVALMIVSARQTLLDICPLPGRSYVGSAVFGLHMPVWSTLIGLGTVAALVMEVTVCGGGALRDIPPSPRLERAASLVSLYVTALCGLNLVAVVLQCGFGACRTTGYALL